MYLYKVNLWPSDPNDFQTHWRHWDAYLSFTIVVVWLMFETIQPTFYEPMLIFLSFIFPNMFLYLIPFSIRYKRYAAVPQQKDPTDVTPLCLFKLYHLHKTPRFEWHAKWAFTSQTQTKDDNSFVCPPPWLIYSQCRSFFYWSFNLSCNCTSCKWYSWMTRKLCQLGFCVVVGQYGTIKKMVVLLLGHPV